MNMATRMVLAALAGAVALPAQAGVAPAPAASGQVILDETGFWHCNFTYRTPQIRAGAELKDAGSLGNGTYGSGAWQANTPFPPDNWMQGDFDDSAWIGWNLPAVREAAFDGGMRGAGSPVMALQCLRGRFLVPDPSLAQDVKLNLAWRGGVVVYLNGKEIARANLPKADKPDFAALADDYPPEAFVRPDGKIINYEMGDTTKFPDCMAKRVRKLTMTVPQEALRKGPNVLAVEVHRAPYFGDGLRLEGGSNVVAWSTCGLVSLSLSAAGGAEPIVGARAKGPEIWNANPLTRLAPGCRAEPGAKLGPMNIVGCRNGRFTAKVVVSSDGALKDVTATAGELKHLGGEGAIPAAAVKLLYTARDDQMTMWKRAPAGGYWDTLGEAPLAEIPAFGTAGAFQAIWVKVAVPAEAAPGDYGGALTVSAQGLAATTVPVRLKVFDWKLPDPRDFVTHMGLIQSPESVALYYKKPLWSEEHWKLMEKSFQMMAEVGARNVYLPLITKTNFGNEQSMVRWVKKQGSGSGVQGSEAKEQGTPGAEKPEPGTPSPEPYSYDFTVFDRYLDLAQKYLKPDVVCLYVWENRKYTFRLSKEYKEKTANAVRVSLLDPATGQVTEMEGPNYKAAEAVGFWKPVLTEVKNRIEKRGIAPAMMFGLAGDYIPAKEEVEMFSACLPGIKWVKNSHPDTRRDPLHGVPLGYNTAVYVPLFPAPSPWDAKHPAGWRLPHPTDAFPRGGCYISGDRLTPYGALSMHRLFTETCLMGNYSGLGRTGVDFWPVLSKDEMAQLGKSGMEGKRSSSLVARYPESDWDQLNMNTATECILAPGPDGALSTERFELLREGVQDSEARIFLEKTILGGKLDAALAKKCQVILDERAWALRAACTGGWRWYEGPGSAGLSEKLYAAAAEVAGATGGR